MNGKVYCNGTRIKCLQQMELTVGMVGAKVEFDFSKEWDGLGKLAVFRSDGSRDVIVDENGIAEVPHEVLTTPGMDVEVGVYAVREDGTTWPSPTPFCKLTRNGIEEGADPSGDESYPPTPDVGEQAVAAASVALEVANEAKELASGAVKSVNGVKPDANGNVNVSGGGGTGSVELDTTLSISGKAADAKAVGDALAELEAQIPTASGGMSVAAANLLLTILRNGVYTSNQSANIDALEEALASSGGDDSGGSEDSEADVTQTGSILSIVSGVTASQSGSVLAIA